jgi:hypothetical protein
MSYSNWCFLLYFPGLIAMYISLIIYLRQQQKKALAISLGTTAKGHIK